MVFCRYDADSNHTPCLKNGHKAHWALVVGVLFSCEDSTTVKEKIGDISEMVSNNLYNISNITLTTSLEVVSLMNIKEVHFLAKQGKSKRPAIWSYESLQNSNRNLNEVDPKRNNSMEYVLPPENQLAGLRGKVIVLG